MDVMVKPLPNSSLPSGPLTRVEHIHTADLIKESCESDTAPLPLAAFSPAISTSLTDASQHSMSNLDNVDQETTKSVTISKPALTDHHHRYGTPGVDIPFAGEEATSLKGLQATKLPSSMLTRLPGEQLPALSSDADSKSKSEVDDSRRYSASSAVGMVSQARPGHESTTSADLEAAGPAATGADNNGGNGGGGNYGGGLGVVAWAAVTEDDAAQGHWHYSHRSPWLRALVLGANDGLVSVSSLMLGVGAVKNDVRAMVISGLSGLVAGAGSMAIGEFVSVFSQRDTEEADIEKERQEHAKGPVAQARELEELAQIYVGRGLPYYLAKQVAEELSKVDVLKAHARDELGIDVDALSNPLQAASASALAFSLGGGVPLLAGAFVEDSKIRIVVVGVVSSIALAMFGAAGARLGGAPMIRASLRVLCGGILAMSLTYGILRIFGSSGF